MQVGAAVVMERAAQDEFSAGDLLARNAVAAFGADAGPVAGDQRSSTSILLETSQSSSSGKKDFSSVFWNDEINSSGPRRSSSDITHSST